MNILFLHERTDSQTNVSTRFKVRLEMWLSVCLTNSSVFVHLPLRTEGCQGNVFINLNELTNFMKEVI